MGSLYCPDEVDSLPHINISVQRTRIRHLVPRTGQAQDSLEITSLAKDTTFWCQGIATQAPELQHEVI